jgi:DNA-directed RNA polymerase beta' subunit
LENGDTVHRHMMDGDAVLFNRQPSLHRMSMMCHIVKIMKQGDSFRFNVACTKPYNADRPSCH